MNSLDNVSLARCKWRIIDGEWYLDYKTVKEIVTELRRQIND